MLFESLFAHARQTPQEVAVIDDRGQYTFQQLAAMAAGLGMYLSFQTKQPNIGLMLPSGAGFIASFYGTLLAGKSAVLINFLLGEKEVAHVIADSGIDTIVTVGPLAGKLKDQRLKIIDLLQLPQTPPAAITPNFPSPKPDDMAALIYTSGTSGLPKGVILTYQNLQSTIDAAIEYAALKGKHRFLGVVPPFHSLGLTATVLAPIQLGALVVYLARFNPTAVMNAIREHQLSLLFAVPSMYGALLHMKNAAAEDFKNIYAAISGGEPLPAATRERWQQRFGIPLYEGYGLTETSGVITVNVPQAARPGSVGRLLPGANARFVDDDGRDVASDDSGEIWLRGPEVMKGYYNLPNETAAVLTGDGYFKTGDIGKMDGEGYLYITGRKKELIIISGEKASPREIEDILMRHPAVLDAAVLGKKDPSRGEIVVAFIIQRDGTEVKPEELKDHCRQEALAQWKIPREIVFVKDLPRSPTGKVLKRVLAEQLNTP
ncbi:MAG TPA: AMP-binding protein [Tepidisphaeraceae bacterium]|jgi:long-chain acyl-CoA synthetase|nr:AMP-binding protein [Tepidisphaeraceae bacterium]